jgi:hypothetical protein
MPTPVSGVLEHAVVLLVDDLAAALLPGRNPFEGELRLAALDQVTGSIAALIALAENYVGLLLDRIHRVVLGSWGRNN